MRDVDRNDAIGEYARDCEALREARDDLRRKLDEATSDKAIAVAGVEYESGMRKLAESRAARAEKALLDARAVLTRVQTYLLCIVPTSNESGYMGMARDLLRDTLATTPDALAPKATEDEAVWSCHDCERTMGLLRRLYAVKASTNSEGHSVYVGNIVGAVDPELKDELNAAMNNAPDVRAAHPAKEEAEVERYLRSIEEAVLGLRGDEEDWDESCDDPTGQIRRIEGLLLPKIRAARAVVKEGGR